MVRAVRQSLKNAARLDRPYPPAHITQDHQMLLELQQRLDSRLHLQDVRIQQRIDFAAILISCGTVAKAQQDSDFFKRHIQ